METAKNYKEKLSQIGETLNETATSTMAAQSVEIQEELNIDALPENAERPSMKDFLDSPMTGKKSRDVKKIAAAALLIGDETGAEGMPDANLEEPENIGVLADEGLDNVKLRYKVGNGQMNVSNVIEYYIDKGAAKVKTLVDIAIDKGLPLVVDKLATFIETKYPQAKPLTTIARIVIPKLGQKAKEYIKMGIDKVAEGVKKVANKACEKILEVGEKVCDRLKKLLAPAI